MPRTPGIRIIYQFQLVAVLREVKYLEIRANEEIPGSAADIYSKNDTFRQYVANLDLTVQWYNKVGASCIIVSLIERSGGLFIKNTNVKQCFDVIVVLYS